VTWDEHSLFVKGERIFIYSGEFHPYRLPVPSLYLDVLQKVKALGFNCVSFYTNWAHNEGTPGEFRAEGVFDLVPFFEAAMEAGIYLIAVSFVFGREAGREGRVLGIETDEMLCRDRVLTLTLRLLEVDFLGT
jgi:hypothetical protein